MIKEKFWNSQMPAENRMTGIALDRGRRCARVAFVVFAGLALSLMSLRAACELRLASATHRADEHQVGHSTGHDHGKSAPCCASMGSALINSAVPDLSEGHNAVLFSVLLYPAPTISGLVIQRVRLGGAPPPPRSYYARSARVLR